MTGRAPIRFISSNPDKLTEAQTILASAGVTITPLKLRIRELQTQDTTELVRHKTLEAFDLVGRPLFVEHTGLYLNHLGGLPGGLTQSFWDALEADRFSELFGQVKDPSVTAKTVIGYTDGRVLSFFEGQVTGTIAPTPRGPRGFQWDCVFVPTGETQTFAEMGDRKNDISMRRRALDNFKEFLVRVGV